LLVSKRSRIMTVSGLCGLASPLLTLSLIFTAISMSPWFSWVENALSDLGVSGLPAIIFNSSLVIGGGLTMAFTAGLKELTPNRGLARIGVRTFILSSVAMCGIGLFPETTGRIHFFFSMAFFVLLQLSMLTLGTAMIIDSSKGKWGWFTLILGVCAIAPWVFDWRGVAIPELTSSLAGSTWALAMGMRMLRRSFAGRAKQEF
jgi:hypothetical membrane protein